MKNLYLVLMLVMVAVIESCTKQNTPVDDVTQKSAINIKLSTKALELAGTNVQTVRIIAYNKDKQKFIVNTTSLTDNSQVAGEGSFLVSIPTGDYTFYAVVNELAAQTTALNQISTLADLDVIRIQPATPFVESTVMLSNSVDATITVNANETALVNGVEAPLTLELERVYTKVSLKINKETVNPADKFTITKVDFVQSPAYSYLNPKLYDGTAFVSREMFVGSVDFVTNGDPAQEVVKEITTTEPSNIFAEYLLADADKADHDKAAYFGIFAQYTPDGGSPQEVYYKIPVGDYKGNNAIDGAGHDYNLRRNMHYALNVKITKMGSRDAVEIGYTVEPWKSEWLDVEIDGDPFLDVSTTAVDVYDAAATRVYFYSNMPDVSVDNMLFNANQSVQVNTIFDNLAGLGATNFKYTYNTSTKRGEGYLDLINLHTDNVVTGTRQLLLKSGKLVREFTATTRVTGEMAKKNSQHYIGTFHRAAERGERIITWAQPDNTQWRVEIITGASLDNTTADAKVYTDAKELRIDRLASPNYSKLYTLDPPNPEGAFVTDDATVTKVEGHGRVYFRVGWASTIGYNDHRFAKIKVTTSTDNFATKTEYVLYCRQGEKPVPILSNTTVFASYNIMTPEVFVDYPTKTGYLYQWNRTQPWAVTGTVNNFIKGVDETGDWQGSVAPNYVYKQYDAQTYICPAKYAYPDAQAVQVMQGALDNAMYQWGYYADGFFDRRAINENIVRGVSGEIATAGGLFFSSRTAVGILLPSATWRDYMGIINSKTLHQQLGVVGHYWAAEQGATAAVARALHLTTKASPDSYLEDLNKASASSVRCMMLEGKTVSFDANGGLSTPRSMTVKSGNITFPAGPAHRDRLYSFSKWTETRGGGGASYTDGQLADVATVGDKTWYAQYAKIDAYEIEGKLYLLSPIITPMTQSAAVAYCTGTEIEGSTAWSLPEIDLMGKLFVASTATFPGKIVGVTNLDGYWSNSLGTAGEYWYFNEWYGDSSNYRDKSVGTASKRFRCVREM